MLGGGRECVVARMQLYACTNHLHIYHNRHFSKHQICHKSLCELVESNEFNLLSAKNIPCLVDIIGQISAAVANGEEIASVETCQRLANILGVMQQQVNGPLIQQAYASLSQEAQHGITLLMGK